jgi:DNA helicase-2/ATP-dependent DNA helicase PcrA
MAYDQATTSGEAWRWCEDAWSAHLAREGCRVVRLHLDEGEAARDEDGAPLIRIANGMARAPDLEADCGDGTEYWEVKYRSRAIDDPWLGRREYWMSYDSYRDYVAVRRDRHVPVWIILHAGPPGDASSRWLKADILDLRDHGRREPRYGRDGEVVDAWVWPISRMTIVDGPRPDADAAVPGVDTPAAAGPTGSISKGRPARDDPGDRLAALCRRLDIARIPQYSVLRFGGSTADLETTLELAMFGIRVFIVAEHAPRDLGRPSVVALRDARLLEWSHAAGADAATTWVVDGQLDDGRRVGDDTTLHDLLRTAEGHGGINAKQYHVVHAPPGQNVMVRAGAGTGKTATMAERIVYLLATSRHADEHGAYPYDLRLDDVTLVTFTREAAQEMRARISTVLTDRRRLCPECVQPVLAWLGQLPGAQISTIHLLAKRIIQQGAATLGFTGGIGVAKLTMERRAALVDALSAPLESLIRRSEKAGNNTALPAAHHWITHLETVWATLTSNGTEIVQSGPDTSRRAILDWGRPPGTPQQAATVEDVLQQAARSFSATCQGLNTLTADQLVPRAVDVLLGPGIARVRLPRYVFVDEFQDTDASQLDLLIGLGLTHGVPLFVVGDVKQGVYHFRGAEGSAFRELQGRVKDWVDLAPTAGERRLRAEQTFVEYTLTYNFRTAKNLLDSLAPYFAAWGVAKYGDDEALLDYDARRDRLVADPAGSARVSTPIRTLHFNTRTSSWEKATVNAVLALRRRHGNTRSIAVLCRENWQARKIQRALRAENEDCEVHSGGGFFRTDAVREAHAFLRAVMHPDDDSALLQLAETRWLAGLMRSLEPFGLRNEARTRWRAATAAPILGWSARIATLAATRRYDRSDLTDLRTRLAELRAVLQTIDPLAFLAQSRNDFRPHECARDGELSTERARYDRCLDHLIAKLDETFARQAVSIATIVSWLELQIATGETEDEPAPPPPDDDDKTTVRTYAVTVHKAKGQQYDCVVVPHVLGPFEKRNHTTRVAVARRPTGPRLLWRWSVDRAVITNGHGWDEREWAQEQCEVRREETRLLYVAMTRAKEHLEIVVPERRSPLTGDPKTWMELLQVGGMT